MRFLATIFALAIATPSIPAAYAVESAGAARERRLKVAQESLKKGLDLLNNKKDAEAIVEFSKSLENERGLDQKNRELALYGRGLAYFNSGNCPSALADLDPLAESKAKDGQYHYIRSVCLDKAGDKVGAAAALDKAVDATPDKPDFVRTRCINRFNAKDYVNAVPDCERVVAMKPDDADVWLAIGQGSELSGQKEKALNAYRKVVALKPDSQPALDGIKRLGG